MTSNDSEGTEEKGIEYSPFGPNEAPGINLVVNMRIYDVLMAIYTHLNAQGAQDLMNIHAKGGILGTLPLFDPDLIREDS